MKGGEKNNLNRNLNVYYVYMCYFRSFKTLKYLPHSVVRYTKAHNLSDFVWKANNESDSDFNTPSTSISPVIYPFSRLSLSI